MISHQVSNNLAAAIGEACYLHFRLVLLVGLHSSGKSETLGALARALNTSVINLSLELAARIVNLSSSQRPIEAPRVLEDFFVSQDGDLAILDNIELLLEPSLRQDSLILLQSLSRNKTLVVSWPGRYVNDTLTYAEPGHPEEKTYKKPEAIIVICGEQ